MLIELLLAGLLIMVASLSGVLFTTGFARQFLETRLSYLVSFSAGVFLVTSGALALEVFQLFAGVLWQGILLILLGYGLAWIVELSLPESHHHHDPHAHDGHVHDKRGAKKLLIGDSIHNIGDGIILVPAFLVSPTLGMAVTASVFIHETLQGISEFFVLKQAGYSTKRTLFLNFSTNGTILLGILLSYFAVTNQTVEGLLLSLSCGFFIHLVIHDLLPRRRVNETPGQFLLHMGLVAVGLLTMALVNSFVSEEGIVPLDTAHAETSHTYFA